MSNQEIKHSKEPWSASENHVIFDSSDFLVGDTFNSLHGRTGEEDGDFCESLAKANARRIVACVNACEGIDTEALEKAKIIKIPNPGSLRSRPLKPLAIMDDFDSLLEQLSEHRALLADLRWAFPADSTEVERIDAAIAKAQGGAA